MEPFARQNHIPKDQKDTSSSYDKIVSFGEDAGTRSVDSGIQSPSGKKEHHPNLVGKALPPEDNEGNVSLEAHKGFGILKKGVVKFFQLIED